MWQGNVVNVLKGTPQSTLQCFIYAQVCTQTRTHTCIYTFAQVSERSLSDRTDADVQSWGEGQSVCASKVWTGLCVRGCGTCCVLPLRGIRVTQQVGVSYC